MRASISPGSPDARSSDHLFNNLGSRRDELWLSIPSRSIPPEIGPSSHAIAYSETRSNHQVDCTRHRWNRVKDLPELSFRMLDGRVPAFDPHKRELSDSYCTVSIRRIVEIRRCGRKSWKGLKR